MRLYYFLDKTYGLEDISKRRLKISLLNDLNDPFELFGMQLSQYFTVLGSVKRPCESA
jgi:hypothetical protein